MALTYTAAISQLLSLADFERKSRASDPPEFHLRRIERLLGYLGNPHLGQRFVHVAGSKGKGSTSAMIAWCLSAGGYKTGLFSSPSIHRITERIRINCQPVAEQDFARLVEDLWSAVEQVTADGDIGIVSVFELQTAMAFCHFAEVNTDISVIEVGLGGRLDSTNIITPLVSVITPISLDHVSILGDTIAKIAAEKAGIIKLGVPVVTSRQDPEALEVIRSTAEATHSTLIKSIESVNLLSRTDWGLDGTKLEIELDGASFDVRLRLLGSHQEDNARTAIATLAQLGKQGLPVNFDAINVGISSVDWPARTQLVSSRPNPIFVDGAHNDASGRALLKTITKLFPGRAGVILIVGSVRGHDPSAVARELASLEPRVIVTESRHPKSLTGKELADALGAGKIVVNAITTSTHQALDMARALANDGDLIVATGSLFVAAEIIEIEKGIAPEFYPDIKPATSPASTNRNLPAHSVDD
ncbi:MAG: bifunctional folylpolyglutamate synthase/dihydrofolate synthase [Chloroflexi bacterium]|nr:bifunctional folylpolyglutamate synthase/dihydrofolate synthase [Chloroflexota bacterium]